MRCTNLSDQFSITGKDLQQFLDLVHELSRNTFICEMATERMELLPVMDTNILKNSFIPSLSFSGKIRPSPGMIDKDVICIGKIQNVFSEEPITLRAISLKQILEKGGSKELFLESKEQSRLFIRYDKKLYFTSPRLAESLCARVKLYGDAIYDTSVEKAAFIMRLLKNSPQTFRALIRTLPDSPLQKIMIFGSPVYNYIPQTFFENVIHFLRTSLGEEPICYSWRVDAFISSIYLEFHKLAEKFQETYRFPDRFIPGLCLATSDTRDASLSAFPTWRLGGAIAEGPGILMEHNGKADISDFNRRICRDILDQYPDFLKRLLHFRKFEIAEPDRILLQLFTRHLKIMKAVGKKRMLQLLPEHGKERSRPVLAYDLIVNLLHLPADCTLPESSAKKLRRAVYSAVYLEDKYYTGKIEKAG